MNWKIQNFFPLLPAFRHKEIFSGDESPPWMALDRLETAIRNFIQSDNGGASSGECPEGISLQEGMLLVNKILRLPAPLILKDLDIFIGQGTLLEPTAIIKSPAVIGDHCEIRQGAYLRGNVLVGDHCTLGHVTEIKNSIMMNHSDAGHFAYIGDSVIGSHVNLGAGTKLANLQFRTKKEKEEGRKGGTIRISAGKEILDTSRRKLGAVIGDYGELGCNSVTSPGALLEEGCWVYPNATVPKGVYPSGSKITR